MVNYLTGPEATQKNLAAVVDGIMTLSVDDTTVLNVGGFRDS
jgi:hypothetical protein